MDVQDYVSHLTAAASETSVAASNGNRNPNRARETTMHGQVWHSRLADLQNAESEHPCCCVGRAWACERAGGGVKWVATSKVPSGGAAHVERRLSECRVSSIKSVENRVELVFARPADESEVSVRCRRLGHGRENALSTVTSSNEPVEPPSHWLDRGERVRRRQRRRR